MRGPRLYTEAKSMMQEFLDKIVKSPIFYSLSCTTAYTGIVMFKPFKSGIHSKESRLIGLFKEVGPNIGTWGKDVGQTYLAQGWQEKDPLKVVAGIPMAAGSALFESFDYLYAGIADEKMDPPMGSRTGRDIGLIMKNNVRHPIRTVLSGFRLFTDLPMDAGDILFRFKRGSAATRSAVQRTLAA